MRVPKFIGSLDGREPFLCRPKNVPLSILKCRLHFSSPKFYLESILLQVAILFSDFGIQLLAQAEEAYVSLDLIFPLDPTCVRRPMRSIQERRGL